MKFERMKNGFSWLKVAMGLTWVDYFRSHKRYQEAFSSLEKVRPLSENKFFEYHLAYAQLAYLSKQVREVVIRELEKALVLIKEQKHVRRKYSIEEQNYLISWMLYMLSQCCNELGSFERAEGYAIQIEQHKFDLKLVRKILKEEYPMRWDINYEEWEKDTE